LADADLNQKIVKAIRRSLPEIDIQTAAEGGVIGVDDFQVLSTGARLGRVIVSHDLSTMPECFSTFIENRTCAGLLLVSQTKRIGAIIDAIYEVWITSQADEWLNRIEYLRLK
jgi:hypothetical protein